ncbi:hypothetical protein J5N97_027591 [Dioscorea zingiberensis]|uniref:Uncharacterized protein n=1 Tax=Dioscorea zingiberensis TaxID=325984 RepID=A0A9D5H7U0_9LILI|nr:hypothetical protein J5N97_027591 [Dioscorea zingiberensis]
MTLVRLFGRPLMSMVVSLVKSPASFATTILFCSDVLPRGHHLERLVRDDVLYRENIFFDLLILLLRIFW